MHTSAKLRDNPCRAVNGNTSTSSDGNGNASTATKRVSVFELAMSDNGGSDPAVIDKLHRGKNPFPAHNFDGRGDDPLAKVKNQVRLSFPKKDAPFRSHAFVANGTNNARELK